ncbi:MarR family winged helix-turn-helix transcriptional regulator [Streptomyces sp. NPDC017936]|uniref:MarR family winged helix-turn-helix transcriptional regulator n=1 Tax=Streptomyces sp. NPDC017936 TaxID=3365016 RepID=UPI0037A542DD
MSARLTHASRDVQDFTDLFFSADEEPMDAGQRSLPQLLGEARKWFDDALLTALEAAGAEQVSSTQLQLFAVLDDDGTTASELARRMGVTRQTAHKAVHTLVVLGLLEQAPHPASARRLLIRRTPKGRRAHERATAILDGLERTLAARIGQRAVADLRAVLETPWGEPPEPSAAGE